MESPLAKVAHQRGPTSYREGPELIPCCAQSLTERSQWEVWLQWEPVDLMYRAGPSVNYAPAAGNLRVHIHGHHITLMKHGFILHTGLESAPPWFLGAGGEWGGDLILKKVSWSEDYNKFSFHLFEIPLPPAATLADLSGLSGSVTQTSTVSEKSHPSDPTVSAHIHISNRVKEFHRMPKQIRKIVYTFLPPHVVQMQP